MEFLTTTCLQIAISAQTLSKLNVLSLTLGAMLNYFSTLDSLNDPRKLAIHSFMHLKDGLPSKCGDIFQKVVSFHDMVSLVDERNDVTFADFHCRILSSTKFIQKSKIWTGSGNISVSCQNSRCILCNDHNNKLINEEDASKLFQDLWNI